ncbi:hypothetical protein GBM02_21115, partial [Yersinia pseudotuberculosis]|nr:hypothetical protein [Yersinia pseudotuberculosis]
MKVGREAWMPSEGRLSRKRIGPVRQRNDESRDPTKWASDSAKARGSKGAISALNPKTWTSALLLFYLSPVFCRTHS